MCVDNDSRPPITPIAGGSAGGRDLRLTSADGTRSMAYSARAATPSGAGMGVIGFYGWPLGLKRWPDRPRPIDAVSRYKSPVLSLFGGADEGIPQKDVDEFDAACKKANVKHDSTVYPGAPHSFFDRKYAEFKDASADAWKRVQSFVSQNTKR